MRPASKHRDPRTFGTRTGATHLAIVSTLVAIVATLVLTGCIAQKRSVGVRAADVAKVELYFYTYGTDPRTVERTTITSPGLIEELTSAFTDVPVSAPNDTERTKGARTAGVRYTTKDGRRVELTQIFVEPTVVFILWQDGSTNRTELGVPLVDYYREGDPTEVVSADEAPIARLP